MRRPSDLELLDIWELGQRADPAERALLFFLGDAQEIEEMPSHLTVGERDSELLHLRELLFGSHVAGLVRCPQCDDQIELAFETSQVRAPLPDPDATFNLDAWGYCVTFRLPTGLDLATVAADALDVEQARSRLLSRCILLARRGGRERRPSALPRRVLDAVAAAMGERDPQGDIRFRLDCPSCRTNWTAPFDIAEFLWAELDQWARRTVLDVHSLARAYGWSEAEILEIPAWRRDRYLELGA